MHLPTLTAVLLSSSEALLPPGLLLTLMRLELRFGRIIALMGRGTPFAGEPGGEVAMGAAYGCAVVCEWCMCADRWMWCCVWFCGGRNVDPAKSNLGVVGAAFIRGSNAGRGGEGGWCERRLAAYKSRQQAVGCVRSD